MTALTRRSSKDLQEEPKTTKEVGLDWTTSKMMFQQDQEKLQLVLSHQKGQNLKFLF